MEIIKKTLFILLYVISIVFSIYASIWYYGVHIHIMKLTLSQWSSFLTPLLVFVYGFITSYKPICGKDKDEVIDTANEMYLLGYMGTIVSIVALILIITFFNNNLVSSTEIIVRSICIALMTTLVGLIWMFVLKSIAKQMPSRPPTQISGAAIQNDVLMQSSNVKEEMGRLASEISETTMKMSQLKEQTSMFNTQMEESKKKNEELTKSFGVLKKNISAVSEIQLPDEVIQSLGKGFKSINNIDKNLIQFKPVLEDVKKSAEIANKSFTELDNSIKESTTSLDKFKTAVKDIDTVLKDFSELKTRDITEVEKEHKRYFEEIHKFSIKVDDLTRTTKKYFEEIRRFSIKVEDLTKTIDLLNANKRHTIQFIPTTHPEQDKNTVEPLHNRISEET